MTATPVTLTSRRYKVRHRVRTCTACDLCTPQGINPVPFTCPTHPTFVVLGEAPGRTENRKGAPFVGPSGRFLRRLLRSSGLNDGEAAFVNVASCWPPGAPTQPQRDACRPNLLAQLEHAHAAGARHLLAAGGTALDALFPGASLRRLHGAALHATVARPFDERSCSFTVVPVYHPAFVLAHDPASKPVLVAGIATFAGLVGGLTPDLFRGEWCSLCERRADRWDDRQVPFCWDHRKRLSKEVNKEKRRQKAVRKAAQQTLI